MSETRRRQRRTPAWRRLLRAWRWWAPVLALLLVGGGGGAYLAQDVVTFSAPRMAGTPLVTARNETMMVLVLTTHQEVRTTRFDRLLHRAAEPPVLHWDLWAFDGRDLRRRWVTRLASVRRGQHDPERGIVGTESGVAWVLANQLVAVNLSGGRVIGDSAMIEARNIQLRGRFPNTRAAFRFERGLIVTAANGASLRVDPIGLSARPLETSERASDAVRPLALADGSQALKRRAIIAEQTWTGMMTADELAQAAWQELPAEPNFALGRPYRLARAQLFEERAPPGGTRQGLRGAQAVAEMGDLRDGGILALDSQHGSVVPVALANPRRFFILHRDASQPGDMLTCVEQGTKLFWQSPLGLVAVTGGVLANEGLPSTWAILLMGRGSAGQGDDPVDAIVRVAARDGTVQRVSIPALPVSQLQILAGQ